FSPTVAVARAQVQQEPWLETTDGTGINISCSHPSRRPGEMISWYRQLPGRDPELLGLTAGGSKVLPDIAGQLWLSADGKSSSLYLSRPRLWGAAVYYCALGA
ncbi:TVA4 protein, partial [Origma solitaria]|nr:TVA4 protein [Origma solitaria]